MSETTNLKLFKHDNPSTNTNQFDVEKSLNENWDKIDTEIGNIRENINGNDTDITDLKSKVTDLETNLDTAQNNIDEIKQEQITQNDDIEANTTAIKTNTKDIEQNTTDITKLQEDNAKLKALIPKGQASGEEISLQDSAEMELFDFGLQGNSKQDGEPTLENPVEVQAVGDSGSVEIVKSNKNILDLGQGSANGITYNKNRITVINPTNSINITSLNLINNKNFMGKSLTLTFWANGNVETNNVEVHLSTNKETYRFQKYFITGNFNNTKFAFTRQLQNDEYFTNMTVYVPTTALPTCNLTIDLQMEIKTATDFIEHKGNTYNLPIQKPFYKLINFGDQSIIYDSFVKQNNKWFEKHNIAKANLENFEWQLGAVQSGTNIITNRWNSTTTLASHSGGIDRFSKCNYLPNVAGGVYNSDKECFGTEYDLVCIRLPKTIATMTTQVKEYFEGLASEGKGAYVIYPLSEPELVECTVEQVQVLEQIVKDGTYKEVTHFYTTQDLKPTIEVKYYKDLETIINKQEQMQATLNNVQAQILELGG